MEQGAFAVRGRAGRRRHRVGRRPVRVRRLGRRRQAPTPWSATLGLTGVPFINVANGCATGGIALDQRLQRHQRRRGRRRDGHRVRQAPARRVRPRPGRLRPRQVVRRHRADAHDAVLRHEDPALHARARHHRRARWPRWRPRPSATARSTRTPGGASRSRRRRCSARRCSSTRSRSTCSARPARAAWRSCSAAGDLAAPLHRPPGVPAVGRAAQPRPFGSFEVFSPWLAARAWPSPTVGAARAGAFEMAGHRARTRSTSCRCRTPSRGAEVMHLAECGFVRGRRAGGADPARRDARSAAGCRSTPTAAASPTASRSGRRACARSTSRCSSCAGQAGARQVPDEPRTAFTHVYGAPGISACTVLST